VRTEVISRALCVFPFEPPTPEPRASWSFDGIHFKTVYVRRPPRCLRRPSSRTRRGIASSLATIRAFRRLTTYIRFGWIREMRPFSC